MSSFFIHFRLPEPKQEIETYEHLWLGAISLLHLALSATPNVITPNVISSDYFTRFLFRSVYALSQFGVQIIESVIFLLHFRIRNSNHGIENYKHFWMETISLLHFYRLPEPNQEIATYEHFMRGTISLLH